MSSWRGVAVRKSRALAPECVALDRRRDVHALARQVVQVELDPTTSLTSSTSLSRHSSGK
jgi:hypothetical protein